MEENINQNTSEHPPSSAASVPQVAIQGIYTKNHQLTMQVLPTRYAQQSSWSPIMDMKANPRFTDLGSGQYEVVVGLHLTLKQNDQPVAEIQLEQAGLFTLKEIPDAQRPQVLYGVCPNSLFPYASVYVNQMLTQAGFPAVFLAPLDFVTLYRQYQEQQSAQQQKLVNTDVVDTVQ